MNNNLIENLNRDELLDIFNSVKNFCSEDISNEDIPIESLDENVDIELEQNKNPNCCEECNENCLVYEDGGMFCKLCGVFKEIRINQDQEWRYYGESDSKSTDPTRVGMPMNHLLPMSSLGTMISSKGKHTLDFEKIRQYHSWNTMPYKERSLYKIYEKLQNKAISGGIPPFIIKNAQAMYKVLSETRISRGSNRRGLMAASVYVACKIEGVPRSAKEIAEIYDLKVNEMTKGVKKFLEIMNMVKKNKRSYNIESSSALDFIQRFCSKLNLTKDIIHLCEFVAYMTSKSDIVDENTPPSIAAGSIYLVLILCNININKKHISQACKISEVTISKCFKKLYNLRYDLIPQTAIDKYNIILE